MVAKCHNVVSGHFHAWAAHALSGLSRHVSAYWIPQSCNLGGMFLNIQRKKLRPHFRMQSECEQTLVSTKPRFPILELHTGELL